MIVGTITHYNPTKIESVDHAYKLPRSGLVQQTLSEDRT